LSLYTGDTIDKSIDLVFTRYKLKDFPGSCNGCSLMTQAMPFQPVRFEESAKERLAAFLSKGKSRSDGVLAALTPDASTREYFRVRWAGGTAVAAVYPEAINPDDHPFLDVTRLFLSADLPVPSIFAVAPELGIIIQEDLGDRQLRDALASATEDQADRLIEAAISMIARIQAATPKAFELGSVACQLAFDEEKLGWELDFFANHYFDRLMTRRFSAEEEAEVRGELFEIARELANRPRVLCHRDYHVANLMVDSSNNLRIVDYQDARMGPASYDLVSLLLDRQTSMPSLATIRTQRLMFLDERRLRGLPDLDPDDFAREFRLMTVQRGLKAVGTFSNQSLCGRGHVYGQFINPTLAIVLQAMEWLGKFEVLRRVIKNCLAEPSPEIGV
jgi:aminoglycoside/choline kinase family phosphotransferase